MDKNKVISTREVIVFPGVEIRMNFSKHLLFFFFAFFSFSILHASPCAADDSVANWVAVTSPSDNWFNGISYGSGNFVTVGAYGTVLTSPDGVVWTSQTQGDTHHLYGVGYGNGTFVAVGTVGTILTSSNGTDWTRRNSGTGDYLYGAAYGNGIYVVVGQAGTILISSGDPNWIWTDRSLAIQNWLYGISYDGIGTFVDVGSSGKILTSPNGVNWYSEPSGTSHHLMGVAYGNGKFVAVGEQGIILVSTNGGTTWSITRQPSSSHQNLCGVAYGTVNGTGYFVTVGESGTILTSPETDLVNWTAQNSRTSYDLEAVAYDSAHSAFAAVGGYGMIVLDGDSIPLPPVRVWRAMHMYYDGIQEAYDSLAALGGDTIQSMALHLNGDLNIHDNITVNLEGGFNSTYSDNPSATTIEGKVTISDGTAIIENIVIQ